ncbi:MAG TPA: prolyl oligopeptidase family serine peptidase, partial [Pirellula sp.]|nr:prolyl oligopeptidase family serine peptidase [Pirellula sp.]
MPSSSQGQTAYRTPPQEVIDIVDAKLEPSVSLSPDARWMVYIDRDVMPDIADLARRWVGVAGMRVDPIANGGFHTDFFRGLSLRKRESSTLIRIPISEPARITTISWSHDSQSFVFTNVTEAGTQLWWVSIDKPDQPIRLTDRLSTVLGSIEWMPDGKRILCNLVPASRGPEPIAPKAPLGPNIQESFGNVSPIRTYQDLLSNAYDEQLFEYYGTSQLAILQANAPGIEIGKLGLIDSAGISPNGNQLLVSMIHRPFSYLLTARSFPHTIQVWNLDGQLLYQVADVPLEENIPIEGVRVGPRSVNWRAGYPATLVWTEALDDGDPRKKVPFRDQIKSLDSPFTGTPRDLIRLEHRYGGLASFAKASWLMATETDRDRRWIRSLLYDTDQLEQKPKIVVDRSMRDRYGDPGRILFKSDKSGFPVAQQVGAWVWLAGQGASPEGNLPFLDRRNLETLETERLWRCTAGTLESVVSILSTDETDKPLFITRRESPSSPSNYYLRDLVANSDVALTDFKDPIPQIRGIKKQIVKYQRSDGVPLSATLYLPANYVEGTRLPLVVWAYPLEFNDASTAGQVSANPSEFTRIAGLSHLTLLTQGYAIMDDATMPVIGDPETMNDTFIEQIVGAAKAAIDKAVEMGVADGSRVGVGGHSYGAFMTANLLAHCNLFRGGIARSGAYNRTLTPFGFQSERRALWDAKQVYANVSPFMNADKIKTPILFVHGENDNNPGT